MTVGRKLKRNVFIDTDIDCQNCGCWQRVCTWNGECDNLEPMTNEEWLKSLDTEQLAEALKEMTYKCAMCDAKQYDQIGQCPFGICRNGVNEFVEWLKQPHNRKDDKE